MRCEKCGVDLGEEYTLCPLCGEKAADSEPVLQGFETAGYLRHNKAEAFLKPRFGHDFPQKSLLRAAWVLCPLLGIVSLFTSKALWMFGVPAVFAVLSAVYFLSALFEKGKLLHNGVSLLATAVSSAVFTLVALIAKNSAKEFALSLAFSAALFIILFAIRPKRMAEQLKALFVL